MNRDPLSPASADATSGSVFRAHPVYGILGAGLLVLGSLLGGDYVRSREPETLVMTLLCLGLAAVHLQWLGSRLTCTDWGLAWRRPGLAPRAIPWQAIRDVQLAGRLAHHVQIAYVAPEAEWLSLPRMRDQARLYRQIRQRLGRTDAER